MTCDTGVGPCFFNVEGSYSMFFFVCVCLFAVFLGGFLGEFSFFLGGGGEAELM